MRFEPALCGSTIASSTFLEQYPRSHCKGATDANATSGKGRVRTGDRRHPVLCLCQLGQDIPKYHLCCPLPGLLHRRRVPGGPKSTIFWLVTLRGMASYLPLLPWESPMASLSAGVGLPVDQLKFTICMILALPVAFIFKLVTRDPFQCTDEKEKGRAIAFRHTLCMIIGVSFMTFLFGYDAVHSVISSAVGFLILQLIPTKNVHIWMTGWAMVYLSCCHISRMIVAYLGWELDFTNPQLLLTQKLMNIAFALYDSSRDPSKCTEEQNKRKLSRPPTFLEYFGYIFALHTLLGGPATDYNDYITWIDGSNLKGERPSRWCVSLNGWRIIPRSTCFSTPISPCT